MPVVFLNYGTLPLATTLQFGAFDVSLHFGVDQILAKVAMLLAKQ